MTDLVSRPVRLTELTDCGGCAAKLGADVLGGVLRASAHRPQPDELIAGLAPARDAAVYRVSPDLAVIGTLDFFPPLVDDPRTFGEIAAANALSDVFAMGGRVLFAMAIAAFPEDMPRDALAAIFDGAAAQGARGRRHARGRPHDPRPGAQVRPRRRRRGASGPAASQGRRAAGRRPAAHEAARDRAPRQRGAPGPNEPRRPDGRDRPDAGAQPRGIGGPRRARVRAATDVTGFGLLGHGLEMARASDARFVFELPRCPRSTARSTSPRRASRRAARRTTAGSSRPSSSSALDVPPELVVLAHDPQTSGGLLAAVPAAERRARSGRTSTPAGVSSWVVGRVEPGSGVRLR